MREKLHGREGNNPDRLLRPRSPAQSLRMLEYSDSRDVGLAAAIILKVRNSLPVEYSSTDNDRE